MNRIREEKNREASRACVDRLGNGVRQAWQRGTPRKATGVACPRFGRRPKTTVSAGRQSSAWLCGRRPVAPRRFATLAFYTPQRSLARGRLALFLMIRQNRSDSTLKAIEIGAIPLELLERPRVGLAHRNVGARLENPRDVLGIGDVTGAASSIWSDRRARWAGQDANHPVANGRCRLHRRRRDGLARQHFQPATGFHATTCIVPRTGIAATARRPARLLRST